jgi:hypothetical protein
MTVKLKTFEVLFYGTNQKKFRSVLSFFLGLRRIEKDLDSHTTTEQIKNCHSDRQSVRNLI